MGGFEQSVLPKMCKGMLQASAVIIAVACQVRLPEEFGCLQVLHVSRFELVLQDLYLRG